MHSLNIFGTGKKARYCFEAFIVPEGKLPNIPLPEAPVYDKIKASKDAFMAQAEKRLGSNPDSGRNDILTIFTESGMKPKQIEKAMSDLDSIGNYLFITQYGPKAGYALIIYFEIVYFEAQKKGYR